MKLYNFQLITFNNWFTLIPTFEVFVDNPMYREKNIELRLNIFFWHFRWLFIKKEEN